MRSWIAVGVVCVMSGGCASVAKEFIPITGDVARPRVPNQQRIVALAANQAVSQASDQLNLTRYAGRTGRVEVNGIFPHSQRDLLEYVATAVEGEMAQAGMRVLQRPIPEEVRTEGAAEHLVVQVTPRSAAGTAEPEMRIVASVDWGGVDFKENKNVNTSRLAAQVGIGVGGVVLGATLIGAGMGSRDVGSGGVISGSVFMTVAPISALIWGLVQSPYNRTFTLNGRVRVTLRAIPVAQGLSAAVAVGEGESKIVIDKDSHSGYTNSMTVPVK